MSEFDSWESYFYPETYNAAYGTGTMRNLYGERDMFVLRDREYAATAKRQSQLQAGMVDVPRTFDAAHVKAIHAYVFQDVYEWAGQYRSVDIAKGSPRGFASVKDGEVDRYLADVNAKVTSVDWSRLDRDEFVTSSAEVFAYLNQAHPFREGNGRTAKIFMEQVAEQSAFEFQWQAVDPQRWNQASMLSGPDMYAYEPHPEELEAVFNDLVVERAQPKVDFEESAGKTRAVLAASYPKAATAATGKTPVAPTMPRGYETGSKTKTVGKDKGVGR